MRQLGAAITILVLMSIFLAGCSDDTQDVQPTGIRVSFTECLTFGIWVFVEGEYQGMVSSEEPGFIELAPGSYELYMRSNAKLGDIYFCWTDQVNVSDGETTELSYSCEGNECTE